jgi:hypothetical protein
MAERNNPYSLKVELNTDTSAVEVIVREKNEKGDFVEIDRKAFPLAEVHKDCRPSSDLYGYSKLLQDRSSDTKAGPDKLVAMEEVAAQLAAGQWERERKAGAPTVSAEVEALAQLKGCSVADIQKSIRKFTKEQKEKILGNAKVTELAATIRANRDAVEVDLTDMA